MTGGVNKRSVEYLLDRQEIYDCICRYTRGVDRHDPEIIVSAYHPDGFDEHGAVRNDMSHFADWANTLHDSEFGLHTHNITTHTCDIDGDEAHAESYVLFGLPRLGEDQIWLGGGRYIDRFERRDGRWGIMLRRTIVDWMLAGDASPLKTEHMMRQGYPSGAQDRTDISYQRPLRSGLGQD
jgi:hypothetical protein